MMGKKNRRESKENRDIDVLSFVYFIPNLKPDQENVAFPYKVISDISGQSSERKERQGDMLTLLQCGRLGHFWLSRT